MLSQEEAVQRSAPIPVRGHVVLACPKGASVLYQDKGRHDCGLSCNEGSRRGWDGHFCPFWPQTTLLQSSRAAFPSLAQTLTVSAVFKLLHF